MTSLKELDYPVFEVDKSGLVYVMPTKEALGLGSPAALKGGYFTNLRITTVTGRMFTVRAAKKVGTKKPWWKPPLFCTILSIDLELEECGTASLREVKNLLLNSFRKEPDSWEACGFEREDFVRRVEGCASFRELAQYAGEC